MAQRVLKQEIVDKIEHDAILYGRVADALDIKPVSLTYLLRNNSLKLTQISVMNVLKKYWGVSKDNDLLEPIKENSNTAA